MHDPRVIAQGRHLALVARDGWEYVTRPHARGVVGIVAVTDARALVLVEQRRPPVGGPTIEIPAGLVGDDPGRAAESAGDAARRELREETGFTARSWRRLGRCVSSGGLTDEAVDLFAATDLEREGPGGGVGGEAIRVHLVPLDGVFGWLTAQVDAGRAVDAKVYAGLGLLGAPGRG